MNIGILAFTTPSFAPVADITVPAFKAYCAMHGYAFCLATGDDWKPRTRKLGFIKTQAVFDAPPQFDALFVVDLDILITNPLVPLESLIHPTADIIVTTDVNGFNSGAYIIRNTKAAKSFLTMVFEMEHEPGINGEQDAMNSALKFQNPGFAAWLPQRAMNSYLYTEYPDTNGADEPGHWQPGDFLLHLPGRSNERRVEIFNSPEIQSKIIK